MLGFGTVLSLMSKHQTQNTEPSQSRTALIVMTIGVIAIAALVGWALTRQVEPDLAPPPEATATTPAPAAVDTSTFTAAPVPTNTAPNSQDIVARIGVTELKAKIARNEVTVIDVRDANAYRMGHIPGSLHIPFTRIEGEVNSLPRSKPIVTYCT